MSAVTNVVIAGLGGQGVLTAAAILADAAFRMGFDVKKAEVHGMSQRGGSVACDVRFGQSVLSPVLSPMVPPGEADYLVALSTDRVDAHRWQLRAGGTLIELGMLSEASLRNRRSLNVALLGMLSARLMFPASVWLAAIRANLPEKLYAANCEAFEQGRAAGLSTPSKGA